MSTCRYSLGDPGFLCNLMSLSAFTVQRGALAPVNTYDCVVYMLVATSEFARSCRKNLCLIDAMPIFGQDANFCPRSKIPPTSQHKWNEASSDLPVPFSKANLHCTLTSKRHESCLVPALKVSTAVLRKTTCLRPLSRLQREAP
jgi:hypothetical protein